VHEIPEASRTARGKSIVNLIQKESDENVAAFVTVQGFDDQHYVAMVTEQGLIKKTSLAEYSNIRRSGIAAIKMKKDDVLKDVKLTDGTQEIVIGTHEGLAIRFHEEEARPMGRTAAGVRAVRLNKGDKVIGAVAIKRKTTTILVVSEHGFGKRSDLDEYRISHRGGKGVFTMKATEKTGKLVAIKEVLENDDIVVVTAQGVLIRQPAKMIRLAGRNTQGVRLIRLDAGDKIAAVGVVPSEEDEKEAVKAEAAKEVLAVPAEKKEEAQGSLFEKKGSPKQAATRPAKKDTGKKSRKSKK
jgi:DNA gyrase subunit A